MHVAGWFFVLFFELIVNPGVGLNVALRHAHATTGLLNDTWNELNIGVPNSHIIRSSPPFASQDSVKNCEGVPTIEENEVVTMLKSYYAAYHREQNVQLLATQGRIPVEMAKFVYKTMHRNCPVAFPAPNTMNPASCQHVAIIKSGQTRSFIKSTKLLNYWQSVMNAFRQAGREPVIFAVLDENSVSPGRKGVPKVSHNDKQELIEQVFKTLVRDHRSAYLSGQGSMDAHRSKVTNPNIKKILTPANKSEANQFGGGAQAGYMKWIIGLDLMLQYERENPNICFSHVIHTRPDYVWTSWKDPNVLKNGLMKLNDAAYIVNDAAAIMPREAAGAYFSTFALQRALKSGKSKWAALLRGLVHTAGAGGLLPPAAVLAYHGILFAGEGLDFATGSLAYPGFEQTKKEGFFVREDQNGPCVENEHFSKVFDEPVCGASFHNDLWERIP